MWLQDSGELATTEQASTEADTQELLSAQQQPDSPTAVRGTGSAGSNATAGIAIAASQSSAGTQSPGHAGTLQAQRQSSPTSGLNKDAPLNNPTGNLSPSQTGNSSTDSRQLPEINELLSEAGSARSNRSPGGLADAHQAARLRGGDHDAAQLQQQQQQRSDAELDPEHVSLPANLPASMKTAWPRSVMHVVHESGHRLSTCWPQLQILVLHAAGQPSGAFSSTVLTAAGPTWRAAP